MGPPLICLIQQAMTSWFPGPNQSLSGFLSGFMISHGLSYFSVTLFFGEWGNFTPWLTLFFHPALYLHILTTLCIFQKFSLLFKIQFKGHLPYNVFPDSHRQKSFLRTPMMLCTTLLSLITSCHLYRWHYTICDVCDLLFLTIVFLTFIHIHVCSCNSFASLLQSIMQCSFATIYLFTW